MTLYFDTKVQFFDPEAISTASVWHPIEPLFAVASYSNEKGGSVTIFDDTVSLKNIVFLLDCIMQILGSTVEGYHLSSAFNITSNGFMLASGKENPSYRMGKW